MAWQGRRLVVIPRPEQKSHAYISPLIRCSDDEFPHIVKRLATYRILRASLHAPKGDFHTNAEFIRGKRWLRIHRDRRHELISPASLPFQMDQVGAGFQTMEIAAVLGV